MPLRLTNCLLIQSVYTSLAGLGQAPAPVEEKREPAVSVRSSVKADHCLPRMRRE
jgi:predicted transcriptional regulator